MSPLPSPLRPALASLALLLSPYLVALAGPWEPLFNGTDLTGWRQLNGTAPYAVVAGAIVGTTVPGSPNSFLATERTFGDFILEFEVKQEVGPTNTGVQFRSESRPDHMNGRVHGYQMEIDPSERAWTGGIYDEARRGWFFPGTLNPAAKDLYQFGRWNHCRIEAIGPSIRTWVNGVPVAHVIDDLTPTGFIALQVHSIGRGNAGGQRIAWRHLRIQTTDLTPAPFDDGPIRNMIANDLAPAEAAQGWRLLWDGKSTAGWRGALQDAFPARGWTIANGELVVQKSGDGGDIVTTDEFAAFELQLEFKLTAGANSGIKYFVTETPAADSPAGSVAGVGAPGPASARPATGTALGLEYQLLDDETHPDAQQGAAGNRTLASLYDLIPRERMPGGAAIVPRIDQWQHARIVVRPDQRVEHWLNGIKVVEYVRGSPLFRALVARSKYAGLPGFGTAEKGRILLQDHGDEVRFRSVKIRPL